MKRIAVAAGAGLIAGLVLLGLGWRAWTAPGPGAGGGTAKVRVPAGMTLSAAADTLAARGLLQRPLVLRVGARLTGRARDLRAGLYELRYGASPRDLLVALTEGTTIPVRVTLPEGWNAAEMAERLGTALEFPPGVFLAAADSLARHLRIERGWLPPGTDGAEHDRLLAAERTAGLAPARWCEGYLAPDTYHFAEGTGPVPVAAALLEAQAARIDSVAALARPAATAGLAPHEIVTLASIVEAEAREAGERRAIAAVYVNRLDRGMRLEADPTVAYATGKKGQRLLYRDLERESAFNTYRRAGLPPGAIGAPGLGCLAAAVQPDTLCTALYFVSDGATGHVFAETLDEHRRNVSEFRRVRGAARRGN